MQSTTAGHRPAGRPAGILSQRNINTSTAFSNARLPHMVCNARSSALSATASPPSLIPETLREMEADTELQQHLTALSQQGQAVMTREEKIKRQRSLDSLGLPSFHAKCKTAGVAPLIRSPARILQINIGLYCNQACTHCHVESSPKRTEMMDQATAEKCVALLRNSPGISMVDITGGAPELHEQFRYLVREARALGLQVLDRCNLTVLLEPGQEDTARFLADNQVRVVASLPCYSASNVDKQRGSGVFERSITALQILNQHGYGQPGTGLQLDLVYNPGDAFLAPSQAQLEVAYKQELFEAHGIVFNSLLALNNMPIKRFADFLSRRNKMDSYMQLLVDNFNPATGAGLMCRDTVSVRWDGRLYDCDFNQQLDLALQSPHGHAKGQLLSVHDITSLQELTGLGIRLDNHCYGCTAGSGSSCQGAAT